MKVFNDFDSAFVMNGDDDSKDIKFFIYIREVNY